MCHSGAILFLIEEPSLLPICHAGLKCSKTSCLSQPADQSGVRQSGSPGGTPSPSMHPSLHIPVTHHHLICITHKCDHLPVETRCTVGSETCSSQMLWWRPTERCCERGGFQDPCMYIVGYKPAFVQLNTTVDCWPTPSSITCSHSDGSPRSQAKVATK